MRNQVNEKRYHKDVYMPKVDLISFWKQIRRLIPSSHYRERFAERAWRGLQVATLDLLKSGEVFEVYTENGKLSKVCVRVKGKKCDSCYVVAYTGYMVTVWSAGKNWKYKDIDKSLYSLI